MLIAERWPHLVGTEAAAQLSPVELEEMCEGWERAYERDTRRLVTTLAHLLGPHTKPGSSADTLHDRLLESFVGYDIAERWETRRRAAQQEALAREIDQG